VLVLVFLVVGELLPPCFLAALLELSSVLLPFRPSFLSYLLDVVWLVVVGIIGAAASVYYYLAIGCLLFFEEPVGDARAPQFGMVFRASLSLLLLGVLVAGMIPAPFWRLVSGL
jgi:NADH:ubiquinone oxidoreductase subunit 5 (subunit L)/multisubunit Na+/H+ antiporter MnhA subunit